MDTSWVDRAAYPFADRYLDVDGGAMHYVDEGQGAPILFVHGTPAWSFLYRHLIADLSRDQRCIAPDHIGFGLSAKPPEWSYSIDAHAKNLAALVEKLGLREITLVVHDLGGPIGLSFAEARPDLIRRLVIFNTTLWPLLGEFAAPPIARLFGGPIGRYLYLRQNVSPRALLPLIYADRSRLTPAIHRQYTAPFPRPADRHGMFAFARLMAGGARELGALWERRAVLADKPALLIWGMKDVAFPPKYLARWRELLPQAQVLEVAEAGHFVQEEAPAAAIAAIRGFIGAPAAEPALAQSVRP
jgi:haloalkane dehalogenase